jgi:hypothetical protein
MDLEEMGLGGVDWTDPAPYREQCRVLAKMVMNLQVPYYAQKFLSSCTTGALWRRDQLHGVS